MTTTPTLDLVRAYCARWEVPLATGIISTHMGPGAFSIRWPSRTIIEGAAGYDPDDDDAWYLLHELSHILIDKNPNKVSEPHSAMLALDFYGARHLKLKGWTDWMDTFGIGGERSYLTWPQLSTRERGALMKASLEDAVNLGLLTRKGRPTFVRQ